MKHILDRGLATALVSAALAVGFAACSSETLESPADDGADAGVSASDVGEVTRPDAMISSQRARERFVELTNVFVKQPPKPDRERVALPGEPEPVGIRPVIARGVVPDFVHEGARLKPLVEKRKGEKTASVLLPTKASEPVRVSDDTSGLSIEFAGKGFSADSKTEVADGLALLPGAAPGGGDVVLRPTPKGVEDFVVFDEEPSVSEVEYVVDVSKVPGLRLAGNSLEFLDDKGYPRLRLRSPYIVGADGELQWAGLRVDGCAYDTSPAAPWIRPITAPGADSCRVTVHWDGSQVAYPAILDPAWVATGDMNNARYQAGLVRMTGGALSGDVLVAAGVDDNDVTGTSEVYSASAGTWAVTGTVGSITTPRSYPGLIFIPGTTNKALLVGGQSGGALSTCELYDPSTGNWSTTGSMNVQDGYPYPVLIAGTEKVYVYHMNASTPEIYNAGSWTTSTAHPNGNVEAPAVAALTDGTVLVAGGLYWDGMTTQYLSTAQLFKDGSGWSATTGAMSGRRYGQRALRLQSGSVFLAGGFNTQGTALSTAELYDPNTGTFSALGTQGDSVYSYYYYNGKMFAEHTDTGRVFYPESWRAVAWETTTTGVGYVQSCCPNVYFRGYQGSAVSFKNGDGDARILAVPAALEPDYNGPSTDTYVYAPLDNGQVCRNAMDCSSGFCAQPCPGCDGVCCNEACDGLCETCDANYQEAGGVSGTCAFTAAGMSDSYQECAYTNSNTCGTNQQCDGAGACAYWDDTYYAVRATCADADTLNNTQYCDGAGSYDSPSTSECGNYACNPTATYEYQSGWDYTAACYTDCNSQSHCSSAAFCDVWEDPTYTCKGKKAKGEVCYSDSACSSGFCRDGVCCEDACTGVCKSCEGDYTGQADGECEPILVDTDPYSECSAQSTSSCGRDGYCDGIGACSLWESDTVCASQYCYDATTQGNTDYCNGSGTCSDGGTTPCATGYACYNNACQTSCLLDAQCASNYYCNSDGVTPGTCQPDVAQGQTCSKSAMCPSNVNCVDGVCCDSACTGTCRSCLKNQTGLASDGLCGNILDDTDPGNECTSDPAYPNSCGAPGLCDGNGACRAYAKNSVQCDADTCEDTTLVEWTCTGAGTCKSKSTPCYPFKCDVGNAVCRVACSDISHCVDGSFCDNGSCVGQLPLGSECMNNNQCASGFCANVGEGALGGGDTGAGGAGGDGAGGAAGDTGVAGAGGDNGGGGSEPGVCCDDACLGTCEACKGSIKGYGSDGVCEFVKNNTDPAGDCEPALGDACGLDGQCNGAGACRLAPAGTSCGDTSCQGNSVLGQSCNGQGDCIDNQGGVDCSPYLCRDVSGAFQCTNPCSEDSDCESGFYCDEGTCLEKLGNGKACTESAICDSGYCVDGVCCDASCNGQCEACDVAGNEGVCTPVQGEPHGARAKCDQAGEECGGVCDGVNAAACKYAATGTACGAPSCDLGIAVSAECNGQGSCVMNEEEECSPYTCADDATCRLRCQQDEHCSQGYACDETTQRCLPAASAAVCSEDRLKSIGQNGETSCRPFLCDVATGACAVACATTNDCTSEFVCDSATKACLPKVPPSEVEEACSCRSVGSPARSSGLGWLAALGLVIAGARRTRRRQAAAGADRSAPSERTLG